MAILLPEVIIKETVEILMRFYHSDREYWISQGQEQNCLLYQLFGDAQLDGFKYYENMAEMLNNTYTNGVRELKVTLGYSRRRVEPPAISILLPNEEYAPRGNTVISEQKTYGQNAQFVNWQGFETTYNLLITSDSMNETVMIYQFLKSIVLAGVSQFVFKGLENISVTGRDITSDLELMPLDVFHRTVSLTFFYVNEVPDILRSPLATGIVIQPTPTP